MGLAERDYYKDPVPTQAGGLNAMSVTTWLIVINVIVFVADSLFYVRLPWPQMRIEPLLTYWGAFTANKAIEHLQLWRFITFQFLHQNLTHIAFNMLALYIFGPLIEEFLGARRYLAFYLICGIAGAALYLLLLMMHVLHDSPDTPMVGASAGIFGVLLAGAYVAPDATVMLLFPPIPLRLRTLAWILIGIALYTVLRKGPNSGGQAAHLGGAALGALLIRRPQWLNWAAPGRKKRSYRSAF
jgi:membrane associated rhomboid family serine protease